MPFYLLLWAIAMILGAISCWTLPTPWFFLALLSILLAFVAGLLREVK